MTDIDIARALDKDDKSIEAIHSYSIAFSKDDCNADDFINASVLCFLLQDYGYSSQHNLTKDDVEKAWIGMYASLEKAEEKYGTKIEIEFWRKYYKHILEGDEFSESEFKKYLDDGVLEACMGLVRESDTEVQRRISSLRNGVKEGLTAKDRYIFSMLN